MKPIRKTFQSAWKRFLARFRLSPTEICNQSKGLTPWADYHDWPDSDAAYPWHMYDHKCSRCGKHFTI